MDFHGFRRALQPVLADVLREKTEACAALVPDASIANVARYAQKLGEQGKRLRPYLVWLLAGMRTDQPFLRFMCAWEVFHLFALVHDDVMDRGTERRGVPTVQAAVRRQMIDAGRVGDLAHVADAQGILVGDLLFVWSRELLDEGLDLVPDTRWRCARDLFSHMTNQVIVGQMVDVDIATRSAVSSELIARKMRLKTASYTFTFPLQAGVALAGMGDVMMRWCEQFGAALGTAFQIQDDLFDLTATSGEMGKSVFSDIRARQHTVLTQWVAEHGTVEAREALAALMGTDVTEADRARITGLFESSGAFAYGQAEMKRAFQDASVLMQDACVPSGLRPALEALVIQIQERRS